jgi:hypothetical protein
VTAWLGLVLALVSAIAVNWAYTREHDAAAGLPPSGSRPGSSSPAATSRLVAFYAFGTMRLQAAFQQGDALTAAGIATLATNAVPIAAGFALFGESLPGGARGGFQIAGFAAVVVGAVVFGSPHA